VVRRPPSSGRVRVAMCGRPDVSRRQTFQILRDEVYSCKEIDRDPHGFFQESGMWDRILRQFLKTFLIL
jgi:hypothetical protein